MTSRGLQRFAPGTAVRRLWRGGHIHWVLWIVCLAVISRIVWLLHINPNYVDHEYFRLGFYDSVFYYEAADGLISGRGYREPIFFQTTALFPPGYPAALAAVFWVFGSSLMVAQLLNVFLAAASAALVYGLATKVRGQAAGVVAGTLLALFPSQIFFSSMTMTGPLFVTLSLALVLLLVFWVAERGSPRGWHVLVVGLLLGFMALVRAEALLLALAVVPVLWKLSDVPWRTVANHVPLLVAGMALVVTPWTVRNYVEFDRVILLRDGDDGIGRIVRRSLSPDYDDAAKYPREDPRDAGELLAYYARRPWQIAVTAGNKVHDLFGSDSPFRWIQDYRGPPPLSPAEAIRWTYVANWYYYIVGVGALLGAPFWLSLRDRRLAVILWFILSWSLIQLVFLPTARHHYALLPMIAVLAAIVSVGVWERLPRARASALRRVGLERT